MGWEFKLLTSWSIVNILYQLSCWPGERKFLRQLYISPLFVNLSLEMSGI